MINIINMKKMDETAELCLTSKDACRLLGVSQATLYAYVSRGLVRVAADPNDGRKSLYDQRDIAALRARQKRPRARRDVAISTLDFGEPSLQSSVSEIKDGAFYYRGQDAVVLSQSATFEDVAKLLCGVALAPRSPWHGWVKGQDAVDRMMNALARVATSGDDLAVPDLLRIAIDAACGVSAWAGETVEQQVARAFSVPVEGQDALRRALVLCADHELNPSTYAARIAVSTQATLPAALVAALAVFSGMSHGRAPSLVRDWVESCLQDRSQLERGSIPPAFGHRVYPNGDPRGREIMLHCPLPRALQDFAKDTEKRFGAPPNVDFALAAFEMSFGLKRGTGSAVFAIGRLCGWIAHCVDQKENGSAIRPRAY